ncbi:hypothetical protein [Lysobacter gummosus]|uniref:hypothetical protein n=1 Tax=Lysobacter gummosus TaxID=262324 RepID=UPI00363258CB
MLRDRQRAGGDHRRHRRFQHGRAGHFATQSQPRHLRPTRSCPRRTRGCWASESRKGAVASFRTNLSRVSQIFSRLRTRASVAQTNSTVSQGRSVGLRANERSPSHKWIREDKNEEVAFEENGPRHGYCVQRRIALVATRCRLPSGEPTARRSGRGRICRQPSERAGDHATDLDERVLCRADAAYAGASQTRCRLAVAGRAGFAATASLDRRAAGADRADGHARSADRRA